MTFTVSKTYNTLKEDNPPVGEDVVVLIEDYGNICESVGHMYGSNEWAVVINGNLSDWPVKWILGWRLIADHDRREAYQQLIDEANNNA